ncbi:MAG: hypothetical protein QM831_31700 [Kofleriaceae bacterium]
MVDSFAELVRHRFTSELNAVCWRRDLAGNFRELAHALAPTDGVVTIDPDVLRDRAWSDAGRLAANAILDDFRALDELGREPVLNCITRYERDVRGLPISTDVFSFHADRAPVEYDTWLCTYWGKSSEAIANDSARRWIDDPEIYAALRRHYESLANDQFRDLVHDESFDLHYRVVEGARPYSFGVGNLWRIAVDWPGSSVRPCLHRAPPTEPGDEPRLLLIC